MSIRLQIRMPLHMHLDRPCASVVGQGGFVTVESKKGQDLEDGSGSLLGGLTEHEWKLRRRLRGLNGFEAAATFGGLLTEPLARLI